MDDSDDDLFAEDDGKSAAALFGLLNVVETEDMTVPLTEEGFAALLSADPSRVLLGNRAMGDAGLRLLADAISASGPRASLAELNLDQNNLTDAGAIALSAVCGGALLPAMETLSVSDNEIGNTGVTALSAALSHMPTLTSFNLNGNSFHHVGISALAEAIAGGALPRLQKLYLHKTSIGDDDLVHFAQVVGSGCAPSPCCCSQSEPSPCGRHAAASCVHRFTSASTRVPAQKPHAAAAV